MKKVVYSFVFIIALVYWMYPSKQQFVLFESFSKNFLGKYPTLKEYTPKDMIHIAEKSAYLLQKKIGILKDVKNLDLRVLKEVLTLVKGKKSQVFMRHARQKLSTQIDALSTVAEKKIAMMRSPENQTSPPTEDSLVDFFSTMVLLRYIQERSQMKIRIFTSPNKRAFIPSSCLASFLGVTMVESPILKCIDYPMEENFPSSRLMRELSEGELPWEEDSVDYIIGKNTHRSIEKSVEEVLQNPQEGMSLYMTHTQQLNAVQDVLHLKARRLQHFGFILIVEGKAYIYERGFYSS